jgi:hypothetical protein
MLRSPVVSDEVAATLQRELVLVRDERLQIEAAIDREPDNVGLRELWAHAYEVELQLADGGPIRSCFGPPVVEAPNGPQRKQRFREGTSSARVHANSMSGSIDLCRE